MGLEPVALPLRKDRQGDPRPLDALGSSGGRHHLEQIRVVVVRDQQPQAAVVAHERARRLQRGRVDALPVRRRDERGTRVAQGLLAERGQFLTPDQARHPEDDQDEQHDRRPDQDGHVHGVRPAELDQHDARCDQRCATEHQQSKLGHPPALDVGSLVREGPHRRMQGGRAPQQVEDAPSRLEVPGLVVHGPGDGDVRVDGVGEEQGKGGRTHQVHRGSAPARAHREADDGGQQDEVHERVGHPHELLDQGRGGVMGHRRHQEHPLNRADPDRHDERVDDAVPVPARVAPADQQEQAPYEARVDQQVGDVADRRIREVGAEEVVVVVGDDVPDDEERLTEREQVPRGSGVRLPHADRDDDGDRGRERDQVEDPSLSQVRQE